MLGGDCIGPIEISYSTWRCHHRRHIIEAADKGEVFGIGIEERRTEVLIVQDDRFDGRHDCEVGETAVDPHVEGIPLLRSGRAKCSHLAWPISS